MQAGWTLFIRTPDNQPGTAIPKWSTSVSVHPFTKHETLQDLVREQSGRSQVFYKASTSSDPSTANTVLTRQHVGQLQPGK